MAIEATQQSLGKDQFLLLFTKQLQYQDPLKPMGSADFTAQMAQFSSLEQMFNMNDNFEKLLKRQESLEESASANLIGRQVKWGEGDEESTGIVTGVGFGEDGTYLMLQGIEAQVPLSEIREIYAQQ